MALHYLLGIIRQGAADPTAGLTNIVRRAVPARSARGRRANPASSQTHDEPGKGLSPGRPS
jgi:hypothetical protein